MHKNGPKIGPLFSDAPKMGHFWPIFARIYQKSQRYCKKFLNWPKSPKIDDFAQNLDGQLQTYNSLSIAERDVPKTAENPRDCGRFARFAKWPNKKCDSL